MRGLKVLVVVMGVLIVAGVLVLGVALTRVLAPAPQAAASSVLDEPAGTGIAAISASADRLAIQLSGGGPDRVVVLDLRTGRTILRAALAR